MSSFVIEAILNLKDNMTSGMQRAVAGAQSMASGVGRGTTAALNHVSNFSNTTGKVMTTAGGAITAMGVKGVKGFGDFQSSLNQAAVIAGGTSKDIDGLADVANRMGKDLPLSAQDCSEAMVEMARNGASVGDIKKQFPAIAQAATASGQDIQTTAGVVQQSMNIWGDSLQSPEQAAAILVQTANASNASIGDMQQALATIGSTAKSSGMDMGTTAEAIGLLTNKGFSAAQASQDLNHALLMMQAPSKKAASQAKELGLSFTDNNGKMKPFKQILQETAKATDGLGDAQKTAALKTMFGTAGYQAIAPLLDAVKNKSGDAKVSWDAYAQEQQKVARDTNTAKKALKDQANDMQQNIGSKIEQVGGNWESLRNKSMAAKGGVTGAMVDMINKTLEWATESDSKIAQVVRGFVGMSPVIGPALIAVGAGLIGLSKTINATVKIASGLKTAFLALPKVFNVVKSGVSLLGKGFSFLAANPIVLVVTAITGLVAVFMHLWNTNEGFRNAVTKIWQSISQFFVGIWNDIKTAALESWNQFKQVVTGTWTACVAAAKTTWNGLKTFFTNLWNSIKTFFVQSWQTIKQTAQTVWQGIVVTGKTIWNGLKQFFSTLWQGIKNVFSTAWQGIKQVVTTYVNSVKQVITTVWNTIKSVTSSIWNAIKNVVTTTITASKNVVASMARGISNVIKTTWNSIKSVTSSVWNGIKNTMSSLSKAIASVLQGNFTEAKKQVTNIWNNIKSMTSTVWNAIKSVISSLTQGISNVIRTVFNQAKSTVSNIWNSIKSVTSSVWNGIKSVINSACNGIKSVISSISGVINGVIDAFRTMANAITGVMDRIVGTISRAWNSVAGKLSKLNPFRSRSIDATVNTAENRSVNMLTPKSITPRMGITDGGNQIVGTMSNMISGLRSFSSTGGSNSVSRTSTKMVDAQKTPATINLILGGKEYHTFVDDISNTQGQASMLQQFNLS